MAQAFNKYNNGVQYIGTAAVKFDTDQLNIVLSNTAPSVSTSTYSAGNITEIATLSSCYTQGTGIVITTTSFTNSSGTSTLVGTAALLTNSNASSFGPFAYAILYDSTNAAKPLLGWWQTASVITMAQTDTFQVSWGSNQILTLA